MEALIVAAQDGVVMTCAYQSRVLKKSVKPIFAESATRCLKQWDTFCCTVRTTSGLCTRKDTPGIGSPV